MSYIDRFREQLTKCAVLLKFNQQVVASYREKQGKCKESFLPTYVGIHVQIHDAWVFYKLCVILHSLIFNNSTQSPL